MKKVKCDWSRQFINSNSIPGLRCYVGRGLFANTDLPWGLRVIEIQGLKTNEEPDINDIVELSYKIGPLPQKYPRYIDQRIWHTPETFIHASTKNDGSVNVYLDISTLSYVTTRDIKCGEELIYHGNEVQIYAMLLHQGNQLTPMGITYTDDLRVKRSTIKNAGNGLFAGREMSSGRLLGTYMGDRKPLDNVGGSYQFLVKARNKCGYVIDGEILGRSCILRYVNHTYDVSKINMTFEQVGVFGIVAFTTRYIEAGEELFADYGRNADKIVKKRATVLLKCF